jgi:hypothetical protein
MNFLHLFHFHRKKKQKKKKFTQTICISFLVLYAFVVNSGVEPAATLDYCKDEFEEAFQMKTMKDIKKKEKPVTPEPLL